MAVKVSYLVAARPSEGERESQIYFLSPRDFWADDGHGERREGFHLSGPPSSANCFYLFRPEPGSGRGAERSRILEGLSLGTCTNGNVTGSGLGWPSLRLSDA